MQSLINLTDLGVLSVIGEDASSFLQGQITCDINEVVENKSQMGAFCNPKGKVIAVFLITKTTTQGFLLILPKSILLTIQELLGRYKLRAKVDISEIENVPISRFLRPTNVRTPWILLETSEQFIPQALKLDETGAVSFTKGCYTGQEIVVRTHYLGDVKRQLTLAICDPSALVKPDCSILDENGEKVGNVLLAQVRGLPRKMKDPVTHEVEESCVNKTVILCVINTEVTNSTLRLDNTMRDILRILEGGRKS
jgi:folate-binding protein YgfZ